MAARSIRHLAEPGTFLHDHITHPQGAFISLIQMPAAPAA